MARNKKVDKRNNAKNGVKVKRIKTHIIGRPSPYKEEYDYIAKQVCAIGATTFELAIVLNVSQPTINKWMRDYHSFFLAVKSGKDKFDTEYVESALLKRAKGYDHTIIEERITKDGDVIPCKKTIHVVADVGSAIFWLCNRQPERWKQISQARFQQVNWYAGGNNGEKKKDKEGKIIDAEVIDAKGVREILDALRESGAMDERFALPERTDTNGDKAKAN